METEPVTTVTHTRNNPEKDSDFNTLGTNTSEAWLRQPQFTILWITPAQHKTNVTDFAAALNLRKSSGGGRKSLTFKVGDLDAKMDIGIGRIKSFLVYKYQKGLGQSYFSEFGIVRKGGAYVLPRDHDSRKDALALIPAAITLHGFTDDEYGMEFWETAIETYNTLLGQTTNVDGTVSKEVSGKNELRKTIVKTHNALIHLLQANYPDTYKSVMREWGFQKEKY